MANVVLPDHPHVKDDRDRNDGVGSPDATRVPAKGSRRIKSVGLGRVAGGVQGVMEFVAGDPA
jgi:hypothetical protein